MAVMTPAEAMGVIDQKFNKLPMHFGKSPPKHGGWGKRRGQNRRKVRNGRKTGDRLSARKL